MVNFFWVGLGGAIGSMLRYGMSVWLARLAGFFPWATLATNFLGCWLLGFLAAGLPLKSEDQWPKFLLMTGFCGGFTTFSTFSAEAVALVKSGNYFWAGLYALSSVVLGLLGVWLGSKIR